MKIIQCSSIAAFTLAVACGDGVSASKAPAAPTVEAPMAAPAPTAPAPQAQAEEGTPAPSELPVPEDFEAQVEAEIRADNYKASLAKLDREIAKDLAK